MTNVSALLISIGTTLGIPAAYFALFRFPESFSEKVGAMMTFHKSHIAQVEDANHILSSSNDAAQALIFFQKLYDGSTDVSIDDVDKNAWLLRVEVAKLQGYRGSNSLTDNFVAVAEEKLRLVLSLIDEPSTNQRERANAIKFAAYALQSANESSKRKSLSNQMLYSAEMQIRQTSIESLKWTLMISMYGLQAYFVAVALWAGYIFHSYGHRWTASATLAGLLAILALVLLKKLADSSVKASSELLTHLKKLIAKGK